MTLQAFIFTVWLLLPDGTMSLSSSLIMECPTQKEVTDTFRALQAKGEIVKGLAVSQPIKETMA